MVIMDYCMYMAITKLNSLNKTKKETGQTTWIPLLSSGHKNVTWDKKSANDNGEIEFYKYTSFSWVPEIAAHYCQIDDKNVNSLVLALNDLEYVVWADVSWLSKHQRELDVIVRRNCRTFCKHVIKNPKRKFEIVSLGKKCENCQFRERIEYENCDKCHVSNVRCKNCDHCFNCAWRWVSACSIIDQNLSVNVDVGALSGSVLLNQKVGLIDPQLCWELSLSRHAQTQDSCGNIDPSECSLKQETESEKIMQSYRNKDFNSDVVWNNEMTCYVDFLSSIAIEIHSVYKQQCFFTAEERQKLQKGNYIQYARVYERLKEMANNALDCYYDHITNFSGGRGYTRSGGWPYRKRNNSNSSNNPHSRQDDGNHPNDSNNGANGDGSNGNSGENPNDGNNDNRDDNSNNDKNSGDDSDNDNSDDDDSDDDDDDENMYSDQDNGNGDGINENHDDRYDDKEDTVVLSFDMNNISQNKNKRDKDETNIRLSHDNSDQNMLHL